MLAAAKVAQERSDVYKRGDFKLLVKDDITDFQVALPLTRIDSMFLYERARKDL